MDARTTLGRRGEEAAARWLQRHGWQILDANVRFREGELDLVACRDGILAFIEVKTRRSNKRGTPAEAVTPAKQAKIRRLAMRYLNERRPHAAAVRFDVVAVVAQGQGFRLQHLESAF
ncbi:MAG: YraN family protein [Actinomycetota bacterium]